MLRYFNWGVFKPGGYAVLLLSCLGYGLALWITVRQWQAMARLPGWRNPAMAGGMVVVGVMAWQVLSSVLTQFSTMHTQYDIHYPAVITAVVGVMLSVCLRIFLQQRASRQDG